MEAREGWRRRLAIASLAALLMAGAAVRLHGLDRSLWLDEAWVANSVLAPDLGDMLRYPAWLQTSPPLFLFLVRAAVAVAGESNAVFRAVPAFFSLAALGLLAGLAWRWLRPPAALVALALFALSPRVAAAGASLKAYASDTFCSLLLLATGSAYLGDPTLRRLAVALAAAAILAPLSFSAPLFLPALLLAALPRPGADRHAPPAHAAAIVATGLVTALALHALCVVPNREPSLIEYFRNGFFPGGGPSALLAWLAERMRVLVVFVPGVSRGGPGEVAVAGLLVVGLGDLVRRGIAGDPAALARGVALAIPIAGTLALNQAGVFPIARGNERPLAFLAPVVVLAVAAGVDALARWATLPRSRAWTRAGERRADSAVGIALAVFVAGLAFAVSRGALHGLVERPPDEDAEGAIALLARETSPEDVLYVHSTMRESFALYARRTPPAAGRVVLGEIDWPCCPRGRAWSRNEDVASALPGEIARIARAGVADRGLWVLVTDREAHFHQRGRRSPELLERGLRPLGCRREATRTFRGVRVDRYACAARPGV